MARTQTVAFVRTRSCPAGLLGFEMDNIFVPLSIRVNCLIPCCSPLKITCSVSRCQIKRLPDSADTIYLKINKTL